MSALKKQSTLLRDFLRTGFRKVFLLCAVGFIAAAVLGYFVGQAAPDIVETTLESFAQQVEDAGVVNEDGSFSPLALLANNWSAMLISALYGLIPFLFLPIISLFTNGFLMGIMAALYQTEGISMLLYAAALIPHGIFELPALMLSIACGIYLCCHVSRFILRHPNRAPMVEVFCDVLRVILLLVAPMTIAAAFIEAYITPAVMMLFM